MVQRYTIAVDEKLCKGCGICVEICPRKALVMNGISRETGYPNPRLVGECVGCRLCMWFCPDQAIVVKQASLPQVAEAKHSS